MELASLPCKELAARPVAGELAHSGCPQSARRLPSKCTPAARLLQSRLEGFGIEREYDQIESQPSQVAEATVLITLNP